MFSWIIWTFSWK